MGQLDPRGASGKGARGATATDATARHNNLKWALG